MEWNEKMKHQQTKEKQVYHEQFLEKLHTEKVFKQEIYAVEKLIEHEDRMRQRQRELEY